MSTSRRVTRVLTRVAPLTIGAFPLKVPTLLYSTRLYSAQFGQVSVAFPYKKSTVLAWLKWAEGRRFSATYNVSLAWYGKH